MVVAAVKNILLHLCLISNFILIGNKGLAHAQNCLKSAETVQVVKNCPENQREWEEAAQRKNCLVIQKYDSCSKVVYHCLVNEFRNETIEVCTNPKYLQGYCPHYYLNEARNDYTKDCKEYSYPCNCSKRYLSSEAYKLQCCFNGTNGDSREILIDNNSDKNSNGLLGLWIALGIEGLVGIVFLACVIYGIKCQNKPLCEALQIWRNISCKSPICACLSSDCRQDKHKNDCELTDPSTLNSIEQKEEIKPMIIEQKKDDLNAEEDDSESETAATLSFGGGNTTSLTPEINKSNSRTSEVDGHKPEAIASQLPYDANSNFGKCSLLTLDLNEKSLRENKSPVQESDPRAEVMCLNPVAKNNYSLNAENTMVPPNVETLDERVKHLEDLKKELEERLYLVLVGDNWFLDYKVRSTKQKMQNMKRNSCGGIQKPNITLAQLKKNRDSHRKKVGMLEEILKKMFQAADELKGAYGNLENFITKPKQKKSAINYNVKDKENAVKSENKLAASNVINWIDNDAQGDTEHQKDYNTHAKEEEMPIRMPLFQPPMNPNKKAKETVFRMPDDDNGASVVKENLSAKDRTRELMINFENWRSAIQEGRSGIDNMEETLLEIEADIVILNRLFEFEIPGLENKTEEEGQQKASNVNNMEQTFEELNEMFDELEKNYK
ncbi:uncharacterized protein LOC128180414 isoform X2 [Crassostrea angulata]|uniref:uncharacterized protein LOC128180414 isoform X2 n=1 Tax=Magallana angulata TaxID=2784310 RepID=UPI0022B14ED7|nr:uncharacterized protein LOC128180414 isoform X2 [Crassostrea angulata]